MTTFRSFATSAGTVAYAEWLPGGPARATVLLVHGGGVGPGGWSRAIGGRPGWAPRLAEAGYRAVVMTWPGLSAGGAWDPDTPLDGAAVAGAIVELIAALGGPVVLVVHSMSAAFGYRVAFHHRDSLIALVALAPAPPGDIQPEPAVLEEDADHIVVQGRPLTWRLPRRGWWHPGPEFIEAKLVGASEQFPPGHLDELRSQLVPIPAGLLLERQNVRGAQVHIGDRELDGLPTLVMVGTHDTDHPIESDRATADWLAERGGDVRFVALTAANVAGNGHMLMQESNSDAVLNLVTEWLGPNVRPRR